MLMIRPSPRSIIWGRNCLHIEHGPEDVDRQNDLPPLDRHLKERSEERDCGIVDNDVTAAERSHGGVVSSPDIVLVRYVAFQGQNLDAVGAHFLGGFLNRAGEDPVRLVLGGLGHQGDVGSEAGELVGGVLPDTSAGARDEDDFSFEVHDALPLAGVWVSRDVDTASSYQTPLGRRRSSSLFVDRRRS